MIGKLFAVLFAGTLMAFAAFSVVQAQEASPSPSPTASPVATPAGAPSTGFGTL